MPAKRDPNSATTLADHEEDESKKSISVIGLAYRKLYLKDRRFCKTNPMTSRHYPSWRHWYPLSAAHRSSEQTVNAVYDKPMIHHPLSTLMLAGIREILIITAPTIRPIPAPARQWQRLGHVHPVRRTDKCGWSAHRGAEFLADAPAALVLGDNLFHGTELIPQLRAAADR